MRSLLICLCLLVGFNTNLSAQQVKPESFVLDNGMEFLLLPRKEEPNSIVAGWVAKVGSVNERPGITGISHFFEHMMFKGTSTIGTRDAAADKAFILRQHEIRDRLRALHLDMQYKRWRLGEIDDPWDPAHDNKEMADLRKELRKSMEDQREVVVNNEFDEIYTAAGATRMNAFTSHDLTCYFISVPTNKFELWAWMESDRLNDSVFREFYSERDVVHEERRLRTESTPTGIFQEQFEALFWQSSPYSWPVIGWTSDLNSYTAKEAKDYFEIYYRPNNLCGVIVGDFDPVKIKAQITKYFSRLKRGKIDPPRVITNEVKQMAEKRMTAECDCQPQIQVRYHTVPFNHEDEFALQILAGVLNGRTGRLHKTMVEDQKIASTARVRQDSRKYAGAFELTAECTGDSTPAELEQSWEREIAKLQDDLVDPMELQKIKNRSMADSLRSLGSNFFLMIQLGMFEANGGWEYINTAPKKLQAVTAEDILRVANEYFTKENRCVAVYTRKAGTHSAPIDPDLAEVPEAMRNQMKQAVKQLAQMGLEQIQQISAQMDSQASMVPADQKAPFNYINKKVKERLAELKAKSEAKSSEAMPEAERKEQ